MAGLLCYFQPAYGAPRLIGLAVGPATNLVPADEMGLSLGFSAGFESDDQGGGRYWGMRGTLVGVLTPSSKALMPTLSGLAGWRTGALDVHLSGGVQLFGVANRDQYTVFATFGVLAGAGMAVRVSPNVRLTVSAQAIYLPRFSAAQLSTPEVGQQPEFFFLGSFIGFEYSINIRGNDDF